MIVKKNIIKFSFLFYASHLIIWTAIPSLTNVNLPLDTIEALAWGSNLDWGFNKHPPFSAFAVEFFYKIFGSQDWAFYLLSQIFVVIAFIAIFRFSLAFFNNMNFAFFSILLLEGIFFFNYTTPEFNVNISQLPFWALSIYFTWRCVKYDKVFDYICLGLFTGLGFLSKYLFIYLILSIIFLFFFLSIKKKIKSYYFFLSGLIFLLIVSPHLIWLIDNNFTTLKYAVQRTGGIGNLSDHFIFPLTFIFKQLIILIPFLMMILSLLKKITFKKIKFDINYIFLFFIFIMPIILIIFTSAILGVKIRTMWMTPFYLLAGVTIVQIFKNNIDFKKIRRFYIIFLFLFILSPASYAIVSIYDDFKRTDYPGKEIARLVQNRWDDNFKNEIKFVVGDEWFAGNLAYHLKSRPKWNIELSQKFKEMHLKGGVIYTGNPKILKSICPGVYGTIKPVGYCMIGQR